MQTPHNAAFLIQPFYMRVLSKEFPLCSSVKSMQHSSNLNDRSIKQVVFLYISASNIYNKGFYITIYNKAILCRFKQLVVTPKQVQRLFSGLPHLHTASGQTQSLGSLGKRLQLWSGNHIMYIVTTLQWCTVTWLCNHPVNVP